ncbi:MAG: hypothetical protein JWN93_3766 [Hyphomicrobiales bacterium]|nr:hypothetical protein [Hyphomicrobiales bacterium]
MRTFLAALLLASTVSAAALAQNSTEEDGHGTGAEPLVTGQPAPAERKEPVIGGIGQADPAATGASTLRKEGVHGAGRADEAGAQSR